MDDPTPPPLEGAIAVAPPVPLALRLGLAAAGLIALAAAATAAWVTAGAVPPAQKIGYVVGYVAASIVLVPLAVCGLFALGRPFRKARSQAVVLLVAWSLIAVVGLAQLASRAAPGALAGLARVMGKDDEKVMAAMNARVAGLQREMAGNPDLDDAVRIQAEVTRAMEETLPLLSPRGRANLAVTMKAIDPVMREGQAYTRDMAAFFGSSGVVFMQARSREELEAWRREVNRLDAANTALRAHFAALQDEVARVVEAERLSARDKRDLIAGFRASFGAKLPHILELRDIQTGMFEQCRRLLELLRDNWGHWQVDDEGLTLWETDELVEAHNAIVSELHRLAERETDVQLRVVLEP